MSSKERTIEHEEKCACENQQRQRKIEDRDLFGHHDSTVAEETILPGKHLPFLFPLAGVIAAVATSVRVSIGAIASMTVTRTDVRADVIRHAASRRVRSKQVGRRQLMCTLRSDSMGVMCDVQVMRQMYVSVRFLTCVPDAGRVRTHVQLTACVKPTTRYGRVCVVVMIDRGRTGT